MANHRAGAADSQRKSIPSAAAAAGMLALFLLCGVSGVGGLGGKAYGTTSSRVWNDPATGLAIGGYDPITYFTDGRPRLGLADYELSRHGSTWRFANSGNMAVFEAHYSVYAPQFGGYDALGVARGVTGPGNPQIWAIDKARLYLFYSSEDRAVWQAQRDKWIPMAKRNWPALSLTLPD